jgi:hypothetical protein
MSKDIPDVRIANWEKCKIPLKEVPDDYEDAFNYYCLVESILHIELHNVRKKFHCQVCKKNHEEWFEVGAKIVLLKRKTWRDWVQIQTPFESGRLTPYWEWRAKRAKLNLSSIKWEEWTQPRPFDYCRFRLETFDRIGLIEHFSTKRKDSWFWFVGIIIMLLLHNNFGKSSAICSVLALLLL